MGRRAFSCVNKHWLVIPLGSTSTRSWVFVTIRQEGRIECLTLVSNNRTGAFNRTEGGITARNNNRTVKNKSIVGVTLSKLIIVQDILIVQWWTQKVLKHNFSSTCLEIEMVTKKYIKNKQQSHIKIYKSCSFPEFTIFCWLIRKWWINLSYSLRNETRYISDRVKKLSFFSTMF